MSARLSDAVFFYENDKKEGLDYFKNKLAERVFVEGLGTLLDKSDRTRELAMWLCDRLDEQDLKDSATYAGGYVYADLASSVVYEFPELQGYMGGRYAELEGHETEGKAMAQAYWPLSANAELPETLLGTILSLSGKIDTLAGNFLIGQIPTGSEDPYALRRQAFAVVRLLLEKQVDISVQDLLEKAFSLYKGKDSSQAEPLLKDFLFQRLLLLMQQRGHQNGLLEAVNDWYEMPLANVELLLRVLGKERGSERFAAAANSAKRVCNILKKAEPADGQVKEDLFELPAERELFAAIRKAEDTIGMFSAGCQTEADCQATLSIFGTFAAPLAKFFTDVMVNVENKAIRENRLALLWRVRQLLTQGLVDISKL